MSKNDNNKLTTIGKLGPLRTGFAAKVDAARKEGSLASDLFDYTKYPNRIVLCVDDSGSMSTEMESKDNLQTSRIDMCRKACEEFLNVCDSRDTALGLYTISTSQEYHLSVAYPMLLAKIRELRDSGGTPTTSILDKIIKNEKVNRVVLVSDGESGALEYDWGEKEGRNNLTFSKRTQEIVNKYIESKVIIDTVFIGSDGDESSSGYKEMKLFAEATNGYFMFFKEGESFRTKFKYLAPAYRAMLVSGEIK